MDEDNPLTTALSDLPGHPCWGARLGHGSMFSLEFGRPSLRVREPMVDLPPSASERVETWRARRKISVFGEWYILVGFCRWTIWQAGAQLASSEDDAAVMEAALQEIDGQAITLLELFPDEDRSRFTFDLGGVIETTTGGEIDGDHWGITRPDGMCFSYFGKEGYAFEPATTKFGDEVRRRMEPSTISGDYRPGGD